MENFCSLLESKGFEVRTMPSTTRTALEAAEAIGCNVAEIAKSIIFKCGEEAILVVACGVNRIDENVIKDILGKNISKADADFVKEKTGFVIGGVPPFGHKEKLITFIDEDLFNYENIWAAAGTSFSVFKCKPEDLVELSNGKVTRVKS